MEEKKDMKKKMKENEKDVKHKTKSIHIDQELSHQAIVIHVHMYTCVVQHWYLYGDPVFQTAAQCVVRLEGTQRAELSKLQYQHRHWLKTHPHQSDDVWVCHVL